jgi:hypothetical protein
MELENFMQHLNSNNRNKHSIPFQVIDAVRLKMRVKEMKEETEGERWGWKESRAACLTFRTKELPSHIYCCNVKFEESTFVAAVQQCYKCGKFGHISKFCTKNNNASYVEKQHMKDLVLKNA